MRWSYHSLCLQAITCYFLSPLRKCSKIRFFHCALDSPSRLGICSRALAIGPFSSRSGVLGLSVFGSFLGISFSKVPPLSSSNATLGPAAELVFCLCSGDLLSGALVAVSDWWR